MGWTYSGNPSTSTTDEVRFLVGDTVEDDPLLQDEELAYLVTEYGGDTLRAAAAACDQLANRFARDVTKSGDGLSISSGERHRQFAERAAALRKQKAEKFSRGTPFAGGISKIDKDSREGDSDRIGTAITLDGFANPRQPWGSADDDRLTS